MSDIVNLLGQQNYTSNCTRQTFFLLWLDKIHQGESSPCVCMHVFRFQCFIAFSNNKRREIKFFKIFFIYIRVCLSIYLSIKPASEKSKMFVNVYFNSWALT